MMHCRYVLTTVALLFTLAAGFVGCTTEVDYTLGEEFVPTYQNMEMRRRIYKGGEMSEGDVTLPLSLASTRLFQSDSIRSANLDELYFGYEKSDTFGIRKAGFMSQVVFGSKLDKEFGWGYRPIFDSMMLSLYVTDFHGDTTLKQRFAVYEITSNDYFDVPQDKDTTFYINFDPTPYIAKEPIFEFTYPDQENGVYVGDMENPHSQNVRLEDMGAATRDYISRLMFLTDLDDNDGYGLDVDSIYVAGNESEFVQRIRGVYIAPKEPASGLGAMFATNRANSALVLYGRSRYKEDPEIIKDTTIMSYNFFINPAEYDVKAGNVAINTVEHNFESATISADLTNKAEIALGYVDGMGGVVTELTFTDELLRNLAELAASKPEAVISINQALLTIYIEGSSYDYSSIDAMTITPIMDAAMPRMGLYTNYNKVIAISDYYYTMENSISLLYDGTINRSLGCYRMDMSTYIQSLILALQENTDENGAVNLEKFSESYEPQSESLVPYRRVYIGPAADAYFGFQRQAIFGGDSFEDATITNDTSITLEITYTIVN